MLITANIVYLRRWWRLEHDIDVRSLILFYFTFLKTRHKKFDPLSKKPKNVSDTSLPKLEQSKLFDYFQSGSKLIFEKWTILSVFEPEFVSQNIDFRTFYGF